MRIKKNQRKDFHTLRGGMLKDNSGRFQNMEQYHELKKFSLTTVFKHSSWSCMAVVIVAVGKSGRTLTDLSVTFTAGYPCPTPRTTTQAVEQRPHKAENQFETTQAKQQPPGQSLVPNTAAPQRPQTWVNPHRAPNENAQIYSRNRHVYDLIQNRILVSG